MGGGEWPATAPPQGAYAIGHVRVLVAGRQAAGNRGWGRLGEGVGGGERPAMACLQGVRELDRRVLVAGRRASGNRGCRWLGGGLEGGRRPGSDYLQGAHR